MISSRMTEETDCPGEFRLRTAEEILAAQREGEMLEDAEGNARQFDPFEDAARRASGPDPIHIRSRR